MEPNPAPNPVPTPTNPNPGALPLEVDPGGLNSRPEVDYGNEPLPLIDPDPGTPMPAIPEREEPPHEPETEPGKE